MNSLRPGPAGGPVRSRSVQRGHRLLPVDHALLSGRPRSGVTRDRDWSPRDACPLVRLREAACEPVGCMYDAVGLCRSGFRCHGGRVFLHDAHLGSYEEIYFSFRS